MQGILFRKGPTWIVWPKDVTKPSLPVLQSIIEPADGEPRPTLVEGKMVDYEVVTIATGTSPEDIVEMDVAKISIPAYIYESPDKGDTIYRRKFGDYSNRELLN